MNTVKDIALHLRYESKRTDLPEDVIQTLSEAYAEISRLERERNESRRNLCYAEVNGQYGKRYTSQEYANKMGWDCFKEENNNV